MHTPGCGQALSGRSAQCPECCARPCSKRVRRDDQICLDLNDAVINRNDLRTSLKPIIRANRSQECGRQFQRDRHFSCGMPDCPGQRPIRKGTDHTAMHEAHAVTVARQHPDTTAKIVFGCGPADGSVTGGERPARARDFKSRRRWPVFFCLFSRHRGRRSSVRLYPPARCRAQRPARH